MDVCTGRMYHMVHSPSVESKSPRQRLLDGAIDHVAEHGISDLSLRELAAALGTSHRMLIHHFGSKERLWVEIVRTVEQRQRDLLGEILPDADADSDDARRRGDAGLVEAHLRSRRCGPTSACSSSSTARRSRVAPTRPSCSTGSSRAGWSRRPRSTSRSGFRASCARAHARLGVAVTRGLLLDLLATGDVAAVDDAMDAFIDVYTGWLANAADG